MKILLLYTYNKGLLSQFYQELSGKLVGDGYEVVNFYLKHKKEYFIQEDCKIYGEKRGGYFHNYKSIYNIIKLTKPDIILSNFSYVNPALLFGMLLRVKSNIVWFHTVYGHGKPNKLKILTKSIFLKMADLVIANSFILQEELTNIYAVPKEKTKSIPFWTNIADYPDSSDALNIKKKSEILMIGCPGRLLLDKNHSVAIKALHQLKSEYKRGLHLYIAGGGPDKSKLEDLVQELDLQNEVSFLGVLTVSEMIQFYKQMDVVVLPSFNEAFGLVFIESIALGRPVIVSSKFGALNFIDQNRFPIEAFAFDPESVKDLKDKLVPYILNQGLPGFYFENLYKSTYDKHIIYQKIKKIINQTV